MTGAGGSGPGGTGPGSRDPGPSGSGPSGSGLSRKEDEVWHMLRRERPEVPAGLVCRAAVRGARRLRLRRAARRLLWAVLVAAVVVFAVWAWTANPWYVPPPAETTPPLEGW
ncbi:hypothetical protein ACFY7Z_03690 [Streptomyces sp. NPDC012623]|uniref:hypothetical protein n=1 Tax=unclassified Streptomyces TaxID=2593676 RepID=UPI0036C904B1